MLLSLYLSSTVSFHCFAMTRQNFKVTLSIENLNPLLLIELNKSCCVCLISAYKAKSITMKMVYLLIIHSKRFSDSLEDPLKVGQSDKVISAVILDDFN